MAAEAIMVIPADRLSRRARCTRLRSAIAPEGEMT